MGVEKYKRLITLKKKKKTPHFLSILSWCYISSFTHTPKYHSFFGMRVTYPPIYNIYITCSIYKYSVKLQCENVELCMCVFEYYKMHNVCYAAKGDDGCFDINIVKRKRTKYFFSFGCIEWIFFVRQNLFRIKLVWVGVCVCIVYRTLTYNILSDFGVISNTF